MDEGELVKQAIDSNWIAPRGPQLNLFEASLRDLFNKDVKVLALNSGTAAIHLGLKLLGVGEGDSVLTPTFSFCASANPILYLGAEPIFLDVEHKSWGVDPNLLEKAITQELKNGRKPKALIVVHTYGTPANMEDITAVAEGYDIPILEDAAESLGATYRGDLTGNLGDVGVLSFNGNKILTTGGGGALVLKNSTQYERALKWATQSKEDMLYDHHTEIGYNYRMSNVSAAIGLGQLNKLSERLLRRREIFSEYQSRLGVDGISFPKNCEESVSNRWLTTILINPSIGCSNLDLLKTLAENRIESRLVWQPLHLQPLYKGYANYTSGVAQKLFNQGLCLPSGSSLTNREIQWITDIIKSRIGG